MTKFYEIRKDMEGYRASTPDQLREEVAKLRTLAAKGKGLKEIAKALNRSEESTKERAKADGIGIAKLR